MTTDYESLREFIRKHVIEPDIKINSLDITKSAITSLINCFVGYGWSVEAVSGTRNRHTLKSPDGRIELAMIDAKIFRHPSSTDQICKQKHITKRMLDLARVPMPAGADFSVHEKDIATAYFKKMPKPVVLKPTDSGGSRGVTVGVTEVSEFEAAWSHALSEGRSHTNVMVEQFIRGVELRAFVVGDKVISVAARIQPYVLGDGSSTVKELLTEAYAARRLHYRAHRMPIVVDWEFVQQSGHNELSVPQKGEILFVNPFSLPTVGALAVDVTDSVSLEIMEMAREAKNAIPGLEVAGIDLLVEDLANARTAYVLEVNTAATPELHRYPTHGRPHAIEKDISEYFQQQYLGQINEASKLI